jgi:hypothetical protein
MKSAAERVGLRPDRVPAEDIGVLHFGRGKGKRRARRPRPQDSARATAATSWAAVVGRVQGMTIATSRIRNGIALEVEMGYQVFCLRLP